MLSLLLGGAVTGESLSEALRAGHYREALDRADALLKIRPRDEQLWTVRGLALRGLWRDSESLASFIKALELSPNFAPALKGAGETAYKLRDPRAAEFLERIAVIEPSNTTAQAMAGVLAYEAGDCASAVRRFERSRDQIEARVSAYAMYGECLLKLNRASEAADALERMASRNADRSILRLLALAQLTSGNNSAALLTVQKIIELAPNDEQNYVDLASTFLLRDAYGPAEFVVNAGLEKLVSSARLYAIRGVIEAVKGVDDAAARDFEKANELDSARQYGAAGFGVLYAGTERAAEAVRALRERLRKDPDDPELNYLLAQAILSRGAMPEGAAEARQLLMRSLRRRPDYAAAHVALGKLYRQAGDDYRAIAEFQAALKSDSADRTALSQLAAALRRIGHKEEAAAAARRLRDVVMREGR
jgi:tetratricopeptide (TPR) repeat protein